MKNSLASLFVEKEPPYRYSYTHERPSSNGERLDFRSLAKTPRLPLPGNANAQLTGILHRVRKFHTHGWHQGQYIGGWPVMFGPFSYAAWPIDRVGLPSSKATTPGKGTFSV